MGCAQSRIDNEESVARCKERKILMKEAVVARNAFAAAHSGYTISLKNTGAALNDYGHGEAERPIQLPDQIPPRPIHSALQPPPPIHTTPQPPPPPPPLDTTPQPPPPPPPLDTTPQPPPPPSMMDNLPPPPPLPNFSPSPVPIKRTVSMPAMPVKTRKEFDASLAIEEEDEEEENEDEEEEEEEEEEENNNNKSKKKDLRRDSRVSHMEEITPPRTPQSNNVGHHHTPPMPEAKNVAWDYFFMVDDNMPGPSLDLDDHINEVTDSNTNVDGSENTVSGVDSEIEPKTPVRPEIVDMAVEVDDYDDDDKGKQQPVHIEHSKTAPADLRRMAKAVSSGVNLMEVLNEIDEHFLKAYESAQEVSKMLEATTLHYHSNFADNRGHIDHSERVMRVITWNKSYRAPMNGENQKGEFDSEEYESHATILEKLLAWEKKLYDEVKQGEMMKLEYKRKLASLNRQTKHGASAESLEKTKAAVSHLHTRYIVDMQSMDSTVSEVNRIRDEQLCPKLFTLVEGMANMWARMCIHHDSQHKIVEKLKSLDIAFASRETTKHHHEQTIQLHNVIQEWHSQFDKLVTHHKQYIRALNNWLKLNLIPIESSLKEKVSSPPRPQNPPIQALLRMWNDYLDKLPDEVAKSAISSFAAVIKTIIIHQEEEMKLKEKCEETRKEYMRKNQAFEEWYHRNKQHEERDEDGNTKNPVSDRQFIVESLKKRLEEEVGAHEKHCIQVREKSLGSLKLRLPEIFRAMSDYSHACSDAYEKLRAVVHSQKSNGAPS